MHKPVVSADDRATELVQEIHTGNPEAEEQFAEVYSRFLLAWLSRNTRDIETARDCCQRTLLIALGKIRAGAIAKPESLTSYLMHTACNVATAHYREEKRECLLGDKVELLVSETGESDSAIEEIDRKTVRIAIDKLLKNLKMPRDRVILRRYYLNEDTKNEICRDMHMSSRHFNRVLYRARKRARVAIENQQEVKDLLLRCLRES